MAWFRASRPRRSRRGYRSPKQYRQNENQPYRLVNLQLVIFSERAIEKSDRQLGKINFRPSVKVSLLGTRCPSPTLRKAKLLEIRSGTA
jgi:hypothetical protein